MRRNPLLDALGAYPITEIQDRARSLRDAGERLIDFSIGDPREPTPGFVREALVDAVPEVSQYPQVAGLAELRRAIAGYVGRRFDVEIDPDRQVIPASGAKEAVFTTPLAFVDPTAGEVGVFATPGYPIHERGLRFAGARAVGVRLEGDFVMRVGDIPWDGVRLVWNCSPQNPTGAVTPKAELQALYEECRDRDALFLSDEAYIDIYEDSAPPSAIDVAGPVMEGALAFLSCSKRSGMTGYRTGAIVGDARAIASLKELRSSVGVASPEFVQAAATAAWSDDDHAAERRRTFGAKRAVLREAFRQAGLEVVASQAGLYVWLAVEDDVVATKRLLEEGVVVSPGSAFGPGGEGYLRLALVPTVDECAEAAQVVVQCLAS